MHKPHARVVELDILRAIAIIMIIFGDLNYFLPTVKSHTAFAIYVGSCGIGLFFFISGYVLYLNYPSFSQRNRLKDFFKKRVLRIFPLYWLSIALMFVLGSQFTSRFDAVVTVLGLQGFLSPEQSFGQMSWWWWFIGVIIVLYTIYPLITTLASDALRLPAPMQSDVVKFALMLIVPFLILAVARSALSIIADGVFDFYGIFVLGVAISKYDVLGKYGFLTENRTRLLKYVAVATVSLTAAFFLRTLLQHSANVSAVTRFASYGLFVLTSLVLLLFALLAFCLARLIVVSFSKASRPLSYVVWYRGLLLISFSAYAIYLFFRPILIQFENALLGAQLTAPQIDIIQIFVGLPTVVVIAYLLQSTQNEILNRVRKYRSASAPSSDLNELH
jgi:peptidoglycan/LPS O-acetylase OafA/YrhL